MPQPKRVFFAYPHSDRAFATRLAKSVAKQGLELDGIDPAAPAARNGIEQLEKRVLSTDAVLLLINPRSKFDEPQQRIWQAVLGAAWANPKLRILPVLLRDAELPPFVRSAAAEGEVQAIRIQGTNDLHQATRAVLEALDLAGDTRIDPANVHLADVENIEIEGFNPIEVHVGPVTDISAAVAFEIYPSFTEADRDERRKRLAELKEYVEQLKH